MNVSQKSKFIKKKAKKCVTTSGKLNIILDPTQWTGSSNWAQFAKTAGIKIKKIESKDSLKDYNNFISKHPNFNKSNASSTMLSSKKFFPNGTTTETTVYEPNFSKNINRNRNFNTQFSNTDKEKQHERKGILKLPAASSGTNLKAEKIKLGNNSTEKFTFNFKNKDDTSSMSLVPEKFTEVGASNKLTKVIAMDCEMVGTGPDGTDSIIARVSIVNSKGDCLYDEFVKPKEDVTDYRTKISGVRPSDLVKGKDLFEVQKDVVNLLEGRILVGHSIKNDFNVLFISHPRSKIRDTSKYKPFRKLCGGRTPSLKKLANLVLGAQIQTGEHSSVEDAQATMQLYMMHRHEWEKNIKSLSKGRRINVTQNQNATRLQDTS